MASRFAPSLKISALFTIILFSCLQIGLAQVATSTNYQLQSDSINFGGGFSTSTNFEQESTFGEIATGNSTSTNYRLRAGYQQMQEVFISLSASADVTMSPSIDGITGGTSNGSTTVTVITDSPAGYTLSIQAESNPAMQNGSNSIADYPTLISRNFTTPAASARFGYSIFSADAVSAFRNNGSVCGSGSNVDLECWRGLTTSAYIVAEGADANHPTGTDTTINFRVGVSSGAGVVAGVYTATTTLTALPL